MLPDQTGVYTEAGQRFFLPQKGQALYHESFDFTETPSVEALEGDVGYIVAEHESGEKRAYRATLQPTVPSGIHVKSVITTDSEAERRTDPDGPPLLATPTAAYEIQEGDWLIVMPDETALEEGDVLLDDLDETGLLVMPAEMPLPFSDASDTGRLGRPILYNVLGVITQGLRLISWDDSFEGGEAARRLVDLAVISHEVQNTLELALLERTLQTGSLARLTAANPVVRAYLDYYDEMRSMHFKPTRDPVDRYVDFASMTADEYARYSYVGSLAREYVARNEN